MKYDAPAYTVIIKTDKNIKYYIRPFITELSISESEGQIAKKVTMTIANLKIDGKNGGYPSSLFGVKDRVYVFAKGVGKSSNTELFRGFIWDKSTSTAATKELKLVCYDNLIYFMNSDANEFFTKGKSTKAVIASLCKSRGVKLNYDYYSITHPKLPLSGSLADIMTTDILDKVKAKKDKKYAIRSVKNVMKISTFGSNTTVYYIDRDGRGIALGYDKNVTMEGMVTKVVITGKTAKSGKVKTEAVVTKNTKEYGTLTKIINKDEDTKLSETKKEANQILKDQAKPFVKYTISALDIPWINKGDKVKVCFSGKGFTTCYVNAITHDCISNTMEIEGEAAQASSTSSGSSKKKSSTRLTVPSITLQYGAKGTQVKNLQQCLNKVMKSGLAVDGSFGPATLKAVKEFQRKYKLSVDGSFGPKSRAKMQTLV